MMQQAKEINRMADKATKRRKGQTTHVPLQREIEVGWHVGQLQGRLRTDNEYRLAIRLLRDELQLRQQIRASKRAGVYTGD